MPRSSANYCDAVLSGEIVTSAAGWLRAIRVILSFPLVQWEVEQVRR